MNSSRATLAMIGTAMIVRMIAAGRIPFWSGLPLKSGSQPRNDWSHGSRWFSMKGPRIRIPHNPRITLGIAASISTRAPITSRTARGASSVR